MVRAQGYSRFPLSKPVVGPNIAMHAVPAYSSSILTWFQLSRVIQLHFPQISPTVECELSCESECLLVVGIHFVSP